MNEVQAILEAFDEAQRNGERCALATVVSVEGSAYRHPGARMLIRESGASVGTVSAGCLESDVIAHAQHVIHTARPKLLEYDTTSTSEEIAWGLGLGCNGSVRVLVEPLDADSTYVAALRASLVGQSDIGVATVFQRSPSPSTPRVEIGARLVIRGDREICSGIADSELASIMAADLRAALREQAPGVRVYAANEDSLRVFIDIVTPPVSLVVFGAGPDVVAMIETARGLGWRTEVVDPQARPASLVRFERADKVTLARPATVAEHVTITPRTLTLLMSHNYVHDQTMLKFLLASPARYIGVLGPRKRTERMLQELAARGEYDVALKDGDSARLYAPVGLDIGANTPAEIALSVIAEMRAVIAARDGGQLRRRGHAPIHERTARNDRASLNGCSTFGLTLGAQTNAHLL
jgi:xanthine/CO dehydrogenase XdhC/CoxF family maturation factor